MMKKYAANAVSLLAAAVAILLISDQEIVGAGIWLIFSVLANMNARTEEIIVVAKGTTDAVEYILLELVEEEQETLRDSLYFYENTTNNPVQSDGIRARLEVIDNLVRLLESSEVMFSYNQGWKYAESEK